MRAEASGALGGLGKRAAGEPLALGLKDRDSRVRVSAVTALGKVGQPGVGPPISLLDDSLVVRLAVLFAVQVLYRSGRLARSDVQLILGLKVRLGSRCTRTDPSQDTKRPVRCGQVPK